MKLELGSVEPSLAGPKRPQDRVLLKEVKNGFAAAMDKEFNKGGEASKRFPVEGRKHDIGHGDVVIAAITSCTNTSNPSVMVGGRPARQEGGREGPEAEAVGEDLARARLAGRRRISRQVRPAEGPRQARLQPRRLRLHDLHRQFRPAAGGDLRRRSTRTISSPPRCSRATATSRAASTPDVRANYLASPPLVVAYALAGNMNVDLARDAARHRQEGQEGLS